MILLNSVCLGLLLPNSVLEHIAVNMLHNPLKKMNRILNKLKQKSKADNMKNQTAMLNNACYAMLRMKTAILNKKLFHNLSLCFSICCLLDTKLLGLKPQLHEQFSMKILCNKFPCWCRWRTSFIVKYICPCKRATSFLDNFLVLLTSGSHGMRTMERSGPRVKLVKFSCQAIYTSNFSMTIFSMTSILVQELAC